MGGFLHLARGERTPHLPTSVPVDNLAFCGFEHRLWIEFLNFLPRFFKISPRAPHSLQKYDDRSPDPPSGIVSGIRDRYLSVGTAIFTLKFTISAPRTLSLMMRCTQPLPVYPPWRIREQKARE